MESDQRNTNAGPAASRPPVGGLSEALDQLEVRVSTVGSSRKARPVEILTRMDEVSEQIVQIEGKISKKTAEAQFEHIQSLLRANASEFLRAVGGASELKALRAQANPPAERWWWYLDEWMAQRSAAKRRAALFAVLGIALGLGILILIYQVFLRPDPAVEAQYAHQQRARDALQVNNLDLAISEVNQSLSYAPEDTSLLALKGVILQKQGKDQEAAQVYAQAETASKNREDFLDWRSEAYLIAEMPEQALEDARAILAIDPEAFHAYMVEGAAYEALGQFDPALEAYGKGYDHAQRQNRQAEAAAARIKIANVLQKMTLPQETPAGK